MTAGFFSVSQNRHGDGDELWREATVFFDMDKAGVRLSN